jgi:hypothetical protein
MRKRSSLPTKLRNLKEFLKKTFPSSEANESPKGDKLTLWIVLFLAIGSLLIYLYSTGKFYEDDKRYQIAKKRFDDSIERMLEAPVVLDSTFLHTPTYDTVDEKIMEVAGRSIKIMSQGSFSIPQMTSFLLSQNKKIDSLTAREFVTTYVQSADKEGVNHDVAFIQMCLETGFLKFDGMVPPDINNFAGIGAFEGSQEIDRYPSMREGVIAHIQHLKAYGSKDPLNLPLIDKHFGNVKRGSAPSLNQLAARWAEDKSYAIKIRMMMEQCKRFRY